MARRTLLRWPGGKTRAREALLPILRELEGPIVSPFFGGGALELELAAEGREVLGFDACEPLVVFWQKALEDPEKLADKVDELRGFHVRADGHLGGGLDERCYARFQEMLRDDEWADDWETAAAFFAVNRLVHSGTGLRGGMTTWTEEGQEVPRNPRLNRAAVARLRAFRAPTLIVAHAEFEESLRSHPDAAVYLDPPYFQAGPSLYDHQVQHERLAEILRARDGQWVLSIDDCEEARRLYDGLGGKMEVIETSYSARLIRREGDKSHGRGSARELVFHRL